MTFYTSRFIPKNSAGCARGPLIFIRPEYRNDTGLLEHEKVHVRQWAVATVLSAAALLILVYAALDEPWLAIVAASVGVHGILYKLIPAYRLHCELEAYREQASHYQDDRMPLFASYIANYYGLRISESEALDLLK